MASKKLTDAEIKDLTGGVDLSRYVPYFYKGHNTDQLISSPTSPYGSSKLLFDNPNDSYETYRTTLRKFGLKDADIENYVNKARTAESQARIGATESDVATPIAHVADALKTQFKKSIGRDPTQSEIAYMLNNAKPGEGGISLLSNFDTDPTTAAQNLIAGPYGLQDMLKTLSPKFQTVTNANLQLKNLGSEISPEILSQILGTDTSSDQAEVLAQNFIKSEQDRKVKEELAGLPGKQTEAIDKLDEVLKNSESFAFNQQFVPSIVQNLNARGILNSGDLTSSLADTAGNLANQRNTTIGNLRAQTSLAGASAPYENALRGALQAGQSLDSAIAFTRNLYSTDLNNQFTASQNQLNRDYQSQLSQQQMALQLAMLSGQNQGGGALSSFLQYGLPVLGGIAGSYAGSPAGGAAIGGFLSNIFGKKK